MPSKRLSCGVDKSRVINPRDSVTCLGRGLNNRIAVRIGTKCIHQSILFTKMSSRSDSPTGQDEEGSDSSSLPPDPTYTAEEISDVLLDFYQFLTTLHYDAADLKIPPPEGWPSLTQELCGSSLSEYALNVMRHIPYFAQNPDDPHVHYKSRFIDYTQCTKADFESLFDYRDGDEFWTFEGFIDNQNVFALSEGYESGGRYLYLNARYGEINEDVVRMNLISAVDMKEYLGNMKEAYRTLKLIPCRQRIPLEVWDIPESTREITKEEVISQTDVWMTNLDVQYIRQVYRHYGWPDHFQREEAFKEVDEVMDLMEEKRGAWESVL